MYSSTRLNKDMAVADKLRLNIGTANIILCITGVAQNALAMTTYSLCTLITSVNICSSAKCIWFPWPPPAV